MIWQLPGGCSARMATDSTSGRDEFLTVYRAAGGTVPSDEYDLIVPLIRAWRILGSAAHRLIGSTCRQDLQQANLRAHTARYWSALV